MAKIEKAGGIVLDFYTQNLQAMWDKVRVFVDDFFADAKKKSQ